MNTPVPEVDPTLVEYADPDDVVLLCGTVIRRAEDAPEADPGDLVTIAGEVIDFDREPRDVASLPAEVLGGLLTTARLARDLLRVEVAERGELDLVASQVALRLDHALQAVEDRIEVQDA